MQNVNVEFDMRTLLGQFKELQNRITYLNTNKSGDLEFSNSANGEILKDSYRLIGLLIELGEKDHEKNV